MITISNNQQIITSTNFWDSNLARNDKFYISTNAGCVRILLPESLENYLDEMKTAQRVELEKQGEMIIVWFDDESDSPFALQATKESFDRLWTKDDAGKSILVHVYVNYCKIALKLPGKILNY